MERARLLLVDDEPSELDLLIRTLKKIGITEGVLAVRDGQEALEFLNGEGRYTDRRGTDLPEVIFLDLKLPVLSGIETIRRIRANVRTRVVPIVVVTSSESPKSMNECYEAGANSCVVKPLSFEKFQEMIELTARYWLSVNQSHRS